MNIETTLKGLLNSGKTLVMPNAYDPISAKIIEYVGFSAIQCSGYGLAFICLRHCMIRPAIIKMVGRKSQLLNNIIPKMPNKFQEGNQ